MSNLLYWRCSRSLYTYLSIRYAGHRPLAPMIRHFHDDDSGHKDTKKNMRPRVANKDEKISTDLKLVDSKSKQKIATGTAPKLSIEQEMKALGHVVGSKQNIKDTISLKSHIHANTTPKSTDAKSSSKSSQTVGDQSKDTSVKCGSNASAVESRVRAFVDSIESKKASNRKPVRSQTDEGALRTTEKQDKSSSPVTTTANINAVTKLTDKCSQASQTESQKVSSIEGGKTDLKTWSSSQSGVGNTNLFDGKPEPSQTKMSQKRSESARNLADKNMGFKSDPQIPWEGMFGELFKTSAKGSVEGGTNGIGSKEGRSQSLLVVSSKQNSKDQHNKNHKLSQVEAKPETAQTKIQSAGDRNIQQSISKTKPEPDQSLTKGARSNSLGSVVQNPPKMEAPSTEIKNKTILNPWKTETSSSNSMDKAKSNQAQTKDPRCNNASKTGPELAVEGNSALKSAVLQKEKSNTSFKFEHKISKPVQSQTEIKTAVIKDDEALKDVLKGSNKHDEWVAKILSPPNKGYESSKIKSNTAYKIEDGFSKAMPHQNKSDNKFAPSRTDEASKDKSKIQSEIKSTATESEKGSKDKYSSIFKADDGFSKATPYQKQPDNKSALNKPSSKFDESKNKSNSIYNVKSWNSEVKQSQNQLIKKSGAMKPDEASKDTPKSFNKDGERFHKLKPSQSQSDNKPSADKLDKTPKNKSNSIYKVTDLSSEALPNQSTNKHGANKVDEASNKDLSTPKETSNNLLESFSAVRSASISDRKFSGDTIKAEKIELLSADTVEETAFKTRSKSAYTQDGINSDLKYRSSTEKPNSYDRKAEIQQSARPQYGLKYAQKTKSTAFSSSQKSNRGTIGSLLQAVRQIPLKQEKAAKGHKEQVVNILKEKIKEEKKKAEFLENVADELRSRREVDTTPVKENKMSPMKSGDAPSTARTETTSGANSMDKSCSDRELTATIAAAIVKGISESSATSKESDTIAGKGMPIVSLQDLKASGHRDCHLTSASMGNSNAGKTLTSYGKTELIGTDESRIGGKRVMNAEPDSKKMDKKFRTDLTVDKGSDNKISKDITCNVRDKSTEKTHKIKAEDITPGVLYNSTTEGENRDFSTNINIEDDDETLRFKAEQFLRESEARQILEKTKHINIEKLGVDKLNVHKLDVDKLDVNKRDVAQLDAAKLDADKRDFAKLDVAKPDVAKLDVDKLDVDELDVSAQQKPKPKLTISQYLYEMFMGKRKNNNESGRRNITTYSAVNNRNSRLDNHTGSKSKKSFTPYASKKAVETFISPDLAKRQLGKEEILKERRTKSQENRHGENDRESRHRFHDQFEVSCSKQLLLPGISSHQKLTLTPDSDILRVQKTESEENLVNFTDDINSTKILGGTPYKCEDKSLRAKLKNKKDKSEIVIKGGSKKCLEKVKDVKEIEDDEECGKRSFGALGRQLFQNLLIYISRIEKKH